MIFRILLNNDYIVPIDAEICRAIDENTYAFYSYNKITKEEIEVARYDVSRIISIALPGWNFKRILGGYALVSDES